MGREVIDIGGNTFGIWQNLVVSTDTTAFALTNGLWGASYYTLSAEELYALSTTETIGIPMQFAFILQDADGGTSVIDTSIVRARLWFIDIDQ